MTKFIFLRGYVGTLNVMDGETYATASFHEQTPEGVMGRRRLYHTDLPEYERQRTQTINDSRDLNDNPIRLFQATTVTTVNPKFWTKVKIVLQESWRLEPIGVVVVSILLTMVTIIGIAKILSIW
jgi:hypothetical protein